MSGRLGGLPMPQNAPGSRLTVQSRKSPGGGVPGRRPPPRPGPGSPAPPRARRTAWGRPAPAGRGRGCRGRGRDALTRSKLESSWSSGTAGQGGGGTVPWQPAVGPPCQPGKESTVNPGSNAALRGGVPGEKQLPEKDAFHQTGKLLDGKKPPAQPSLTHGKLQQSLRRWPNDGAHTFHHAGREEVPQVGEEARLRLWVLLKHRVPLRRQPLRSGICLRGLCLLGLSRAASWRPGGFPAHAFWAENQ